MDLIMKIKKGFVIREVMGQHVAVAVGEAARDFRGMVKLNSTAVDIWKLIDSGLDENGIVSAMLEEYDVDRETLCADVRKIISELCDGGFVEL